MAEDETPRTSGVITTYHDRIEFRPTHNLNLSIRLAELVRSGDVGGLLLYGIFMQQAQQSAALTNLVAMIERMTKAAEEAATRDPSAVLDEAMRLATEFADRFNGSKQATPAPPGTVPAPPGSVRGL